MNYPTVSSINSLNTALVWLVCTVLAIVSPLEGNAQKNDQPMYEKEWKQIDSLTDRSLPASALARLDSLKKKIDPAREPDQFIKVMLYKSKFKASMGEEGLLQAIQVMEEELATSSFPVKNILQSILANLYDNYLLNSLWSLRDRTATDAKTDDIQTWSVEDFIEQINKLYSASLAEKLKLYDIAISDFPATIESTEDGEKLRPTLYDFLAHRAIDYYATDRQYLTQPAYRFDLDSEAVFDPVVDFVQMRFETADTASQKLKAILLIQDLLAFRINDKDNLPALVDLDLKRLKMMKDISVNTADDKNYEAALLKLIEKYKNNEVAANVHAALAAHYYKEGLQYEGQDEIKRWRLKDAFDQCNICKKEYADTEAARRCASLQNTILSGSLGFAVESINLPDQPILMKVDYKNVEKVYVKVVRINETDEEALKRRNADEQMIYLRNLGAQQLHTFDLPDPKDFRAHSVELKLDPLEFGRYCVLVSEGDAFNEEGDLTARTFTHVSQIAYFQRTSQSGKLQFVLVDRQTGEPEEGVKAEYFVSEYNSRKQIHDLIKIGEDESDENGFIQPRVSGRTFWTVKFSKGKDQIHLNDNYRNVDRYNNNSVQYRSSLFLDRAIYRPGQTIYFKGIVLKKNETELPAVVPNKKVKVTLYDVNNQKVETLTLTSNEYGSIHGQFTAPSGLPGSMYLLAEIGENSSTKSFSVEEYKRPRFEVNIEDLDKSYSLDEEVTVTVDAKAFAGNPVDGAELSFVVNRTYEFPWRPYWFSSYSRYRYAPPTQITQGTIKTDKDGKASFTFKASPDLTIEQGGTPVFNFEVVATVVDITGETRESRRTFRFSELGLVLEVDLPEQIDRRPQNSFTITASDLNGDKQEAAGKIEVSLLDEPDQSFVDRYWEEPDQFVYDEETFKKFFPDYAYQGEQKIENWEKKETIAVLDFNTANRKEITLATDDWKVGTYLLTFTTKDNSGNEVKISKTLKVYDGKSGKLPLSIREFAVLQKNSYQPGEDLSFRLFSNVKNHHILFEEISRVQNSEPKWNRFSNTWKYDRAVVEKDRGGLYLQYSYVSKNRFYLENIPVRVPWDNKKLTITYESFRDKLKPGQEEEWRVKISGTDNDKLAAEMLVAMYDQSLDEFAANNWYFSPYPNLSSPDWYTRWNSRNFKQEYGRQLTYRPYDNNYSVDEKRYPSLDYQGLQYFLDVRGRGVPVVAYSNQSVGDAPATYSAVENKSVRTNRGANDFSPPQPESAETTLTDSGVSQKEEKKTAKPPIVPRTNLNETVFFKPSLKTDKDGNIIISFKMNEALTKWKFLGLAHTKDLEYAVTEKEIVTQKELMVLPNAPRNLRQGDEIVITSKVVNLSAENLTGVATLQLFDAVNMQPIEAGLLVEAADKNFSVEVGRSAVVSWKLAVPDDLINPVVYRILARAGDYTDGEENGLPVLSKRIMVTETQPIALKGNSNEAFDLKGLRSVLNSKSARPYRVTMEVTSNPAWLAVKSLPYLMTYPYECTEQIFNRYYANSMAHKIANSNPKIKEVFEKWKNTSALDSELSMNEDLKSALLAETPWVMEAQSEAQQRKNIGILFDKDRIDAEIYRDLNELADRQMSNGGFPWFPGGRANRYITQLLLEGLGHLDYLGVNPAQETRIAGDILPNALRYIDSELADEYQKLEEAVENGHTTFEEDHLSYLAIHYLYVRSFFPDIPVSESATAALAYYEDQAAEYWPAKGLYQQGMIGLSSHRKSKEKVTAEVINSLKERAIRSEELGVYWKYNRSFWWYELPIETHAMLIELFAQAGDDQDMLNQMKVWLLKNKQTNRWGTTKATAAAVFALLDQGNGPASVENSWLGGDNLVKIKFPELKRRDYKDKLDKAEQNAEPGTGYYKVNWQEEEINEGLSEVKIKNKNTGISWGAIYWQYFEDIDNIESYEDNPLSLKKAIFLEETSDAGKKLKTIDESIALNPGDKLTVRIELRVDRDMEYVHMKDMRGIGLEPAEVLSGYRYQGGLGYYQAIKDTGTNFFFDYLPKGTYVFEYPLRVVHKGSYTSGITTIQSMYAPEFTSHSNSIKLEVK